MKKTSLFFHDSQMKVHEIVFLDGEFHEHLVDHLVCLGRLPSFESYLSPEIRKCLNSSTPT